MLFGPGGAIGALVFEIRPTALFSNASASLNKHVKPLPSEMERTGGSQCLVAGAEGIRTAGPLCASVCSGKARDTGDFNAAIPKKYQQIGAKAGREGRSNGTEKFSATRHSSHGPAENERIPNSLPEAKDPKETGGSNPSLQQRGTANRHSQVTLRNAPVCR